MNILCIGDVVGTGGCNFLRRHLPQIKKEYSVDFVIANGENSKLVKIAIFSPKSSKCFPCGACRQWIQEFAKGYNTEIILEDENGNCCSYFIDEILPYSFNLI